MKVHWLLSMLSVAIATLMIMPVMSEAFLDPSHTPALSTTNILLHKYMKASQAIPAAYSHCLTHHHLATECVTAGCMACLGDYIAQRKSQKPWDAKRSLRFVLKGLGEGMMWSWWYHHADQWVATMTQSALSTGLLAVSMIAVFRTVVSLVMDLFIACPFIYSFWDIPLPAVLSGTPFRTIPRLIKSKLGEMMLASVKVWLPVNILIYNSPLQYRVLISATADVFWQSIVSAIASRELTDEDSMERGSNLVPQPQRS